MTQRTTHPSNAPLPWQLHGPDRIADADGYPVVEVLGMTEFIDPRREMVLQAVNGIDEATEVLRTIVDLLVAGEYDDGAHPVVVSVIELCRLRLTI